MRTRVKTALGIDICGGRIGVALIEKGERGVRVVASARGDLPPEARMQSPGSQPRQSECVIVLSRLLRQLGRRVRRRGIKAALALSTQPLVMQLLDVPKNLPVNVSEVVGQELRQCVALSGKETRSDFCGVGVSAGPRKRLLAVATDAGEVREMVRACQAAGITVQAAEPAILACARALLQCDGQARYERNVLIAVLGACSLAVCLFRKDTLDLVRVREIPCDVAGAEPLCKWLAEELRAVRRYYAGEAAGDHHKWQAKLIVHEAGCAPVEIRRLMTAEAGMDCLTVLGPCDDPVDQDAAAQAAPLACLGAALKLLDAERDDLRINLLPQDVTKARLLSKRLLVAANVAALVFLGLLLVVHLLTRATDTMRRRIEQTRVSRQVYTTPALIAQERFLDQEIARVQQQVRRLRAAQGRREPDWPAILNAVRRAMPTEVCITQLTCNDNRCLLLKGLALSCAAAQQFVGNLGGPGPFESISLARVERQQNNAERVEYQIDCVLRTTD